MPIEAGDPLPSGGGRADNVPCRVIVFVILGQVPVILLVAQIGMLYLTWLDLRGEPDLDFQVKVWWFLLVLLFNVIGFLGEKLWITARRQRRRREAER
jgi:hypothetical protein